MSNSAAEASPCNNHPIFGNYVVWSTVYDILGFRDAGNLARTSLPLNTHFKTYMGENTLKRIQAFKKTYPDEYQRVLMTQERASYSFWSVNEDCGEKAIFRDTYSLLGKAERSGRVRSKLRQEIGALKTLGFLRLHPRNRMVQTEIDADVKSAQARLLGFSWSKEFAPIVDGVQQLLEKSARIDLLESHSTSPIAMLYSTLSQLELYLQFLDDGETINNRLSPLAERSFKVRSLQDRNWNSIKKLFSVLACVIPSGFVIELLLPDNFHYIVGFTVVLTIIAYVCRHYDSISKTMAEINRLDCEVIEEDIQDIENLQLQDILEERRPGPL